MGGKRRRFLARASWVPIVGNIPSHCEAPARPIGGRLHLAGGTPCLTTVRACAGPGISGMRAAQDTLRSLAGTNRS